ncbi:hypothetical protein CMUS01_03343 [Colletotrichum musicola]|uniref:DNA replication factor Cdt1 C-terminal domain-containing protein n=1 Tax=Colletotrichum musicola TaxID=2175873 RepID=A0A8H6NTD5_9PEZI|nr:hypothetical protein CMUS01_03343 [Colletotrichum musicola]
MARAASRRQVKPAAPPATNLISKYGRVSKAQAIPVDDLKKAFYIDLPSYHQIKTAEVSIKTEESPVKPLSTPAATPSCRKRKAVSIEDESPSKNSRSNAPSADTLKRQRMSKDGWNDKPVPVKNELVSPTTTTATSTTTAKKTTTPSAADTHRKARKSTVISQAKTEVRKANVKASRSKRHNAPAEPAIEEEEPAAKQLPAELLELLDLQRAILKTVSIQVIHQGSNSPIDISAITPHVSRTWGKRKVTTDDIRRCIAIQDMRPADREQEMLGSPFIVTDYGRGKLCLEMDLGKVSSGPMDEQKLCRQFEENLRVICADRATDEMTDLDACFENLSFADLPKSDITVRHDAAKRSAVLARGQRALTELKNGITIKKQEKESKALGAKTPALNADGTKMSLLDRIKAKEAANAHIQLPSGPELIRKRALQRVSDIAAIISMLVASSGAAGQAVMSFQMAVLQQKLKDSVRVPMPMEEGVEVVRIIANEVAPEWLRLATVGGKEHVVIQTRRKPYDAELAARVNRLS